jgi:hypothetical protein
LANLHKPKPQAPPNAIGQFSDGSRSAFWKDVLRGLCKKREPDREMLWLNIGIRQMFLHGIAGKAAIQTNRVSPERRDMGLMLGPSLAICPNRLLKDRPQYRLLANTRIEFSDEGVDLIFGYREAGEWHVPPRKM